MSTEQVPPKPQDPWKAVKELLQKAEAAASKGINRAAPALQKSIDTSLETAAKGFASTMRTIDSATEKEQLDLLKVYSRFLIGQSEFVQSRIRNIEEKGAKKSTGPEVEA